jgi:hypothetical protein
MTPRPLSSARKYSMSRKKISTTIYVTPEQNERLRILHDRTKVPVAVYIREGIDLVLRQYGHLLPGQLQLATPATPEESAAKTEAASDGAPRLAIEKQERIAGGGKV